jgi:RNA polymerase sigma-70 factor (ECF subfamily)
MTETTSSHEFPAGFVAASSETHRQEPRARRKLDAAYVEHAPRLGRLAYLLTGDAAVAEDLVQEAFVRAFARFAYLHRQDAVAGYLRRTVVNLARKHFRRVCSERAHWETTRAADEFASQPEVALREQLWCAFASCPTGNAARSSCASTRTDRRRRRRVFSGVE